MKKTKPSTGGQNAKTETNEKSNDGSDSEERFAPEREPLPPPPNLSPRSQLPIIQKIYSEREHDYFPSFRRSKLKQIFELFSGKEYTAIVKPYIEKKKLTAAQKDSNERLLESLKDYLSFSETKDVLMASNGGWNISEQEELLKQWYELLSEPIPSLPPLLSLSGLSFPSLLLLLTKTMQEQDRQGDIIEALKLFAPSSESGLLDSDDFFEFLTTKGYKYSEKQAKILMSIADPKNTGLIDIKGFAKVITGGGGNKGKRKK